MLGFFEKQFYTNSFLEVITTDLHNFSTYDSILFLTINHTNILTLDIFNNRPLNISYLKEHIKNACDSVSRAVVVLLVPLVLQWHPTSVRVGAILARLNNGTYHLRTTESMRAVRIPGVGGRGCQRRRELHRSSSCRATGRREGPCYAGGRLEIYLTSRSLRPPGTENNDLLYCTILSRLPPT